MSRPTRRRKQIRLPQLKELVARIVEIREHGQKLRYEHDRLMEQLNQSISSGDVIEITLPDGTGRRVTVYDPFLTGHGRTVSVTKSFSVDRFQFVIEDLPCQNDTAQGDQ